MEQFQQQIKIQNRNNIVNNNKLIKGLKMSKWYNEVLDIYNVNVLPKELQFDCIKLRYEYYDGLPTGRAFVVIHQGNSRHIGSSVCSKKDQFSRKVGRTIALQRAVAAYIKYSQDKVHHISIQPVDMQCLCITTHCTSVLLDLVPNSIK